MTRESALLRELTRLESTRVIVALALRTNRDPWAALGLPHDGDAISFGRAAFLADLLAPKDEVSGMTQSQLDEAAEAVMHRMDARDAWKAAVTTGYRGPRGRVRPLVRLLAAPPIPPRPSLPPDAADTVTP